MICNVCGETRGNRRKCKECNRRYQKKWYQNNKEVHKERVKKVNQRVYDDLYNHVYDYLHNNPCVDCGETDIVVLHFDHREQSEKISTVSQLIRLKRPIETIQSEIDKCDVRCANCHLRRTAKQLGWKKLLIGDGR